jgi:hypothetical protein
MRPSRLSTTSREEALGGEAGGEFGQGKVVKLHVDNLRFLRSLILHTTSP